MRQPKDLESWAKVTLHESILDILFKHKKEVSRKLSDIRGLYQLDHVAIHVLNPCNEISIFSITPSVEYNLITNNIWQWDGSFKPHLYSDEDIIWWDQAYAPSYANQIRILKEKKHNFSLGFTLFRKLGQYTLAYSFATRCQNDDLREYYLSLRNELYILGDYGYMLIRDIYSQYCSDPLLPNIAIGRRQITGKGHLKLIINN